jgi:adenylate kinase
LVQRSDDIEETVMNRLKVYQEQTQPLLNYYEQQGNLTTLDGNRDSVEVFRDVKAILENLR